MQSMSSWGHCFGAPALAASCILTILSGAVTAPLSSLAPFLILSTASMPEFTWPALGFQVDVRAAPGDGYFADRMGSLVIWETWGVAVISSSIEAKMSKEDSRGYPADLASSASSCAISLIYAAVKFVFASSFVWFDFNIAFVPIVILQNNFFIVMMLYIIAWFILDEL
jgi:hypothetical protein